MRHVIHTNHTTLVFSPFGGGYVQEHRGEEKGGYLARAEDRGLAIDFGAMLASLRAALFLR